MIRSMLFIPGNNPGMLLSVDIHRADAVILDLEDAVSPAEKDAARLLVRNAVQAMGKTAARLIVRINPWDTPEFARDIAIITPLKPYWIMPTKVSGPQQVADICRALAAIESDNGLPQGQVGLIPLLETAQGIEEAYAIARADSRVQALQLGAEDLSSDLQAVRSKEGPEIAYARGRIVNAARAAGIEVYDTPFTDVNDEEGMRRDAQLARALGFSGKAAISPRHVDAINEAFTPTAAEILYAREVMAVIEEAQRLGKGAVALRGKMVDKPIVDRARRVLDNARALGLEEVPAQ